MSALNLTSTIVRTARQGWKGQLPPRYSEQVDARLRELASPALRPGAQVLDVGSGRRPVLSRDERPPSCRYVGLDVSWAELQAAPAGAYDQLLVADVADYHPELATNFDLALSWWVLEHVRRLDHALENLRRYLRPGSGRLIAFFSGRRSAAGVANRVLPYKFSRWLLKRFNARQPDSIFPAFYDRCTYDELRNFASIWPSFEVTPVFQNAQYLRAIRPLLGVYLVYEEWAYRTNRQNLATHYLLVADA